MVANQARYSRSMAWNRAREYCARSILLTSTASWRTPSKMEEITVASGVLLHAFVGINQQQCGLGIGGAGDHVFQELLVTRGIDDDVLAFGRSKPDLSRVDGDVLVTLGLERVHEIGPLEWNAPTFGHQAELFQFPLRKGAGVVEQPAHEGGLAVVDVADDDDLELLDSGSDGMGFMIGRRVCSDLHVAVASELFEGILAFLVLGAAGAFGDIGGAEFLDDFRDGTGVGFDGKCARVTADGAIALAAFVGKVQRNDRNVLALDVLPDVQLRPVQQRMDPDMRPFLIIGFELIPELGGWSSTFHSMLRSRGLK
jgi:hypothetical protein